MNQLSFVDDKLVLALMDKLEASVIDLKDVYFVQIEPLKTATSHYHLKLVFQHKDKLSNNIMREQHDGKFVQCIELHTMFDKIDTTKINHPSFILIDKGVAGNNHFQLLNLDYTDGFEIRHAQKEYDGREETFYEISYYKQRGYFDVEWEQTAEIQVSIVFNYLYEYYIEVNIPKFVNYVKNKLENPNNIISFYIEDIMEFVKDKQLDNGYMNVKPTW